ncbi:MAG: succinylglutamate desuccinylase/aspartoacylase family protein [Gammaproteobacteria bacterium]|nr:succinylglutamate desuccinylase/aspartoacylase family protein [Gammaproteobacteria bacterium]
MSKVVLPLIWLTISCFSLSLQANTSVNDLDFTLHKLDSGEDGPTLLVIGGIQGDEPGGFTAASLLVTDYQVKKGSVWVVPNLNFKSIIKRSRGVHGDMNRKFLSLPKADPEYEAVEKIKSIILDKKVDVILNLHDGSGFYHPVYINKSRNPRRWGQSVIIDQAMIEAPKYGDLAELAERVCKSVNNNIKYSKTHYHVKNTNTRDGDVEMEKTLTYFAIRNNKPAFGVEASKDFRTHTRALYHLRVVESMMGELGIEYERGFKMSLRAIKKRIDNNVKLAMFDNKVYLDMAKARSRLSYIPMKKGEQIHFSASNPLIAVIGNKKSYKVRYGNRSVTQLHPQYFEYDDSLSTIKLWVDGELKDVPFGTVVDVKDAFKVEPLENYRTNIIGFARQNIKDDSGVIVKRKQISKRYSVDRASRKYRVELYREGKFCGMILVNFIKQRGVDFASTGDSG